MQKLLFITTNLFGPGGVSRVLSVRLDYLIKKYNYTIHVVTTNNLRNQLFYNFNKNIVFHDITVNFKIGNIGVYKKKLKSIVEKVEPNIIINCDNGLKGALLPYLVTTKVPLIYERHGSRKTEAQTFFEAIKNRLGNVILSRSIEKYRAFVVLNKEDKREWNSKNSHIIPNPISFKKPKAISELQNKTAIAVGRHAVEKQFDKLLKIWEEVVKSYTDWVLEIYGESDADNSLQKLTRDLGIGKNVKLFNSVENIEQKYKEASMLLHTSKSEAFGLVIIEAMAYGLPVIAFDKAHGPKSLIIDNSNGYLIKHNDLKAYANKIKFLISNSETRTALGKNGTTTAQNYNLDVIVSKWHNLYEMLK